MKEVITSSAHLSFSKENIVKYRILYKNSSNESDIVFINADEPIPYIGPGWHVVNTRKIVAGDNYIDPEVLKTLINKKRKNG